MNIAAVPSAKSSLTLPEWVPDYVLHYLAHTEMGQPIRALARAAGVHASTVMRQIRRLETRRDDPLVDAALRRLGAAQQTPQRAALPDGQTLNREALRVLRRLCESGAVLAVAAEMDKAVVVRDSAEGGSLRTAVVASSVAQAMALQDWIAAANTGRIVRYHITSAGRAALAEMLDDPALMKSAENGFAESQTPFAAGETWSEAGSEDSQPSRRMRYSLAESPIIALSRRRDHSGAPFLSQGQINAGERLREDFELAQMGTRVTQDWGQFLTPGSKGKAGGQGGQGPSEARARVAAALADLGPGLSDVVLRCCCYLEGLETTEKRLGWSARSGKIVLRIALIRLAKHYEETTGPGGPMIG